MSSDLLIKINSIERIDGRTQDSVKYRKDCPDFECLEDGTITKEYKYCNRSHECRQIGFMNGKPTGMLAHNLPVLDPLINEIEWYSFCTGMYDLRPLKERYEDDTAH
jgi:hypothetical protein